jgi:hypothetical protein
MIVNLLYYIWYLSFDLEKATVWYKHQAAGTINFETWITYIAAESSQTADVSRRYFPKAQFIGHIIQTLVAAPTVLPQTGCLFFRGEDPAG